jgi:DNA-binding response OmpR family regulator
MPYGAGATRFWKGLITAGVHLAEHFRERFRLVSVEAEYMVEAGPYDVVVLDLGLPGRSGLEVLQS